MTSAADKRPPLTPRYWPGWLLVGFMWLLGKTPRWLGLALSGPLGWLFHRAVPRRRRVAERNIERCFPELTLGQRDAMVRAHFKALARMIFEVTWAWSGSKRKLARMGDFEGFDHAWRCLERGQGVLLITAHFTCLEIGGRLASLRFPEAKAVYRPLNNPVLEWYQNRSRHRYTSGTISKRAMREVVRHLRKGGLLWYAPDQDFGARRSQFVPFFGIQTATLEATVRMVELSGCAVVPMFPVYDAETRRYKVRIFPPLDDFPSGDAIADLARLNRMMEEQVRLAPEQYWWIHRRFKTRPEGEPSFYD